MSDKRFEAGTIRFVIEDAPAPAQVLRGVAGRIEQEPERWDQQDWIDSDGRQSGSLETFRELSQGCGTTFCQAGFAVANHAHRIMYEKEAGQPTFFWPTWVPRAAQLLMGLDIEASANLFDAAWPRDCGEQAISDILQGRRADILEGKRANAHGDDPDRRFTIGILLNLAAISEEKGPEELLNVDDLATAVRAAVLSGL